MWLRTVYKEDQTLGRFFVGGISFYLLLHILQVEVYPFYLYAMYSLPADQKVHTVYHLTDSEGKELDMARLPYRQYIQVQHVLSTYDNYKKGDQSNVAVIDKMVTRLGIQHSSMAAGLRSIYYPKSEVDPSIQQHLKRCFQSGEGEIFIIRKSYDWTETTPKIIDSQVVYP